MAFVHATTKAPASDAPLASARQAPGSRPLVTAAWAAIRVKATYLRAQFLRIKARRREEGSDRGGRLHPASRVLHAQRPRRVPGSRRRSLRTTAPSACEYPTHDPFASSMSVS